MPEALAIEGGRPVRDRRLPYGRQVIEEEDVEAVSQVLRGDWLTTGPMVERFEQALCAATGAADMVAVSNGTTALHAMMVAAGVGPGDEVIVPAITFVASANAVVYAGGRPVIVDVKPGSLLLDPEALRAATTPRTRAVLAVDYGGQPADYAELGQWCDQQGLRLLADGAHALGATYRGRPAGQLAQATTFSFHPVKHIATGEGGAVATALPDWAAHLRRLRNHGISRTAAERERAGTFRYEMAEWGHNFRLNDIQCALGVSQLRRLPQWLAHRRLLADRYDQLLADIPGVEPLSREPDRQSAWHLYTVRLRRERFQVHRDEAHRILLAEGIGVNVHYLPVHMHAWYQQTQGTRPGQCPVAEAAYEELLTLPLSAAMGLQDQDDVLEALRKLVAHRGIA